jgi:hypothetical protein
MRAFAGLDVSLSAMAICIVDSREARCSGKWGAARTAHGTDDVTAPPSPARWFVKILSVAAL